TTVDTIAGIASVSTSVGVGASVSTVTTNDTTEAYIVANASVTALGLRAGLTVKTGEWDGSNQPETRSLQGLGVSATSFYDLLTIAAGFTGGSDVGVGGSVTVNTLNAHTHAWIGDVNVNPLNGAAASGQEVLVLAAHETHLTSVAGGAQFGGTAGIGAGV